MPIPFLSSINLTKNEVENFKIYNLANDPGTLTSGGDFGYFWLNTSSQKTLKWWDGANVRSIVDSTNIGSYTSGLATDLAGGAGGYLPYQAGTNDTTFLPLGTAAQILAVNSGITGPEWINQSSMSVGSATTATTANAVANALTAGSYLTSGGTYNGSVARTFAVDATDANTASKVVARDASGNFAAGTITAAKVTGLSAPTAGSDAANRDYVDSVAQGLDVKASCKAATVSNINLASPGATIDTVSLSVDNRVLVKDQSAPAENGIYLWKGAAVAMVRSPDADTWDDLVGAFTFVEEGTAANADSGWVCSVNAGGTLGSTAVTWVKFSQAGSYTAGNGIVQSGTSFNFAQSTPYTAGQIPFAGGTFGTPSTTIGFDSSLVWDDQNNRLGVGTSLPAAKIHIADSQLNSYAYLQNDQTLAQFRSIQLVLANGPTAFGSGNRDWRIFNLGTSATASDFAIDYWDGSTVSEKFRIASNGVCTWSNVGGVVSNAMVLNGTGLGIGASPSTNLHVYGAAPRAMIENSANNGIYLRLKRPNKEYIVALDINNNGGNDFTIWDNTAAASRLTIDNVGNVGINTATPAYKLDVINSNVSGTSWSGIRYRDTSINCEGYVGVYNSVVQVGATSNHSLDLYAGGSNRVRIDTSGNVGIGTATIPERLTVSGNVLATDSAGTYPRFISTVGAKSWEIGYRSGTTNYELREDGTTRLVVANGGNVGINTTTPLLKFVVSNAGAQGFEINPNSGGGSGPYAGGIDILCFNRTTSAYKPFASFAESFAWLTATTGSPSEKMVLTTAGNLGLGVTPSAWGTAAFKAIDINTRGAFAGTSGGAYVVYNAFYNASNQWIYKQSDSAAYYAAELGAHKWYIASSGTAGNAITFTQAMTLDASGNLSIGTTAGNGKIHVAANGRYALFQPTTSTSSGYIGFSSDSFVSNRSIIGTDNSTGNSLWVSGGAAYALSIGTVDALPIVFATSNTERLRIKSTGQVNFVGQASDPAGAAGDVVYNSTSNRLKYHNGTAWVDSGTRKVSVVGGAGTGTYIDATHNFNTKTVSVTVLRTTDNVVVYADVAMTNDNTVRVTFASSVTLADYTVTVIG